MPKNIEWAENFENDDHKVTVWHEKGLVFRNGDYRLAKHQDILKAIEIAGQQLLDEAKKEGIQIMHLPEFKHIDFEKHRRNKHIDAKEVGAILLAASMSNDVDADHGTTGSTFDNVLTQTEMKDMRDPDHARMVGLIAHKILQDNGIKAGNGKAKNQTNEEFTKALIECKKHDIHTHVEPTPLKILLGSTSDFMDVDYATAFSAVPGNAGSRLAANLANSSTPTLSALKPGRGSTV